MSRVVEVEGESECRFVMEKNTWSNGSTSQKNADDLHRYSIQTRNYTLSEDRKITTPPRSPKESRTRVKLKDR